MKLLQLAIFALTATRSVAQESLVFRAHDSRLGYFCEVHSDEKYNRFVYVYRNRADAIGKPVFTSDLNIYSAFHSPDGKFFVVNYGSTGYGNVAVVFRDASPKAHPYISESDFRRILDSALRSLYPRFDFNDYYHLYAPIRDIRDGHALLYASGDFSRKTRGVFLALDLERRSITRLDEHDGLKCWYRGLPDEDAIYGSGFFVTSQHILTNAHVVGDAKRVVAGLGNKEAWAKVVATSKTYDLALLVVDENSFTGRPITLAPDSSTLGQKIRAYGYPLPMMQGYTLKATDGTVSGLFGLSDDPLHFQTTAPLQPGNSGGAIVDEKGRLTGVAVASLDKLVVAKATGILPENVNLGIHLDVVRKFLEDQHVTPDLSENSIFDPELSCVQIIRSK